MNSRRRLLFISPRFLFPMNEGGKIRTGNILRAMHGGAFHVTMASPAPPDAQQYAKDIDAVCDEFVSWPEPSRSTLARVRGLLSDLPVGVWTDRSAAGSAVVAGALQRADAVVVDFPHSAVLTPPHIDIPSIIFTHNVETEIFERHARLTSGAWRAVWRNQAQKMERFEATTLARMNKVIAVSQRDAEALCKRFPVNSVETIDTGVDPDFFSPAPASDAEPDGGTICFTGIMDSPANIDAVRFFADEVWPHLTKARRGLRMTVIGRNPPESLVAEVKARNLAWTFTGYVDDVRPWMAKAQVSVIPIRAGSGTRIKAFEALAMAKPLVSTRLGVEGLPVEDGRHFLAADTGPEFAAAVLRVLGDGELRRSLAKAGRALVEERYSWNNVARQFEAICLRAMQRSPSHDGRVGVVTPLDAAAATAA